jgi:hypothetical protein
MKKQNILYLDLSKISKSEVENIILSVKKELLKKNKKLIVKKKKLILS